MSRTHTLVKPASKAAKTHPRIRLHARKTVARRMVQARGVAILARVIETLAGWQSRNKQRVTRSRNYINPRKPFEDIAGTRANETAQKQSQQRAHKQSSGVSAVLQQPHAAPHR
jgi:hypothetical protein